MTGFRAVARLAKFTAAGGVPGSAAGTLLPAADHPIGGGRGGGEDDKRILFAAQQPGRRTGKVTADNAGRPSSHQSPLRQTNGDVRRMGLAAFERDFRCRARAAE